MQFFYYWLFCCYCCCCRSSKTSKEVKRERSYKKIKCCVLNCKHMPKIQMINLEGKKVPHTRTRATLRTFSLAYKKFFCSQLLLFILLLNFWRKINLVGTGSWSYIGLLTVLASLFYIVWKRWIRVSWTFMCL